ncbi:MAG: hypothetical protein A4E32_00091 [Methanomassiliicoccales archaeon PtaU1.Bin124]|nr:MAG: hypothetical protein A4E32_00091 [Methanomassiliicoccales archaeon PtaU1.Bin124]
MTEATGEYCPATSIRWDQPISLSETVTTESTRFISTLFSTKVLAEIAPVTFSP